MALTNTATTFGSVTKFLHWVIALLVIFMIPLGFLMGSASSATAPLWYALHKSCGLTILFLTILMYLWRLMNKRPQYPADTPIWRAKLANWTHSLLYILLFVQTLTGWIMTTAAGHAPNFWWLIVLPMPGVSPNPTIAHIANIIHSYAVWLFIAVICLHILGALFHWWVCRDGIFERMQPNFTKKKKRFYDN